jgi:hypothetical protein
MCAAAPHTSSRCNYFNMHDAAAAGAGTLEPAIINFPMAQIYFHPWRRRRCWYGLACDLILLRFENATNVQPNRITATRVRDRGIIQLSISSADVNVKNGPPIGWPLKLCEIWKFFLTEVELDPIRFCGA